VNFLLYAPDMFEIVNEGAEFLGGGEFNSVESCDYFGLSIVSFEGSWTLEWMTRTGCGDG